MECTLHFDRVLIVEDNEALRGALSRRAATWSQDVVEARCADDALAKLDPVPDLIIADVRLPGGGSGLEVLAEASKAWPKPTLVAISGRASAEEAFRLAELGVRAYLPKPFTLAHLEDAVGQAVSAVPDLEVAFSQCVGRVPMKTLQDQLRGVMVHQALAQARGSRTGAARLLEISRQAVQQVLRRPTARSASTDDASAPRADDELTAKP